MRTDSDGSNATSLIRAHVGSAACSPDGKFVYYDQIDRPQKILKIPVEGGASLKIADVPNDQVERLLAISPDGSLLAYLYHKSVERVTCAEKLAVISSEDGRPLKVLSVPGGISRLRWSPDGRGLQYKGDIFASAATNVWEQRLAGGEAKQLTKFSSGRIFDFNWSIDGKSLLLVRGNLNGDVVLVRNFR